MLIQAYESFIRPNQLAQPAKDKIDITHEQGHGLWFSLSAQSNLTRRLVHNLLCLAHWAQKKRARLKGIFNCKNDVAHLCEVHFQACWIKK